MGRVQIAVGLEIEPAAIAKARAELEAATAEHFQLQFGTDLSEANRHLAAFHATGSARTDIGFGADLAKVRAGLAAFIAQVEADAINLRIEADLASVNAEFQAALHRMERTSVDINVGAQIARARAGVATFIAELERTDVELQAKLRLDRTELVREVARARVEAEAALRRQLFLKVGIDIDTAGALAYAEAAISGFERTHPGVTIHANIETELNQRKIAFDLAALKATAENIKAEVALGAEIDRTDVRTALLGIKAMVAATDADVQIGAKFGVSAGAMKHAVEAFQAAGQQAGDAFSSGLSGGGGGGGGLFTKAIPVAAIGVVLHSIQPVAVAIEGTFGAAVAVVSSGMSALIGTAGAAVPILAGLATTVGTVAIAFEGLGDALPATPTRSPALTPEAREFAEAFDRAEARLRPTSAAPCRNGCSRVSETNWNGSADVALPGIRAGLEDSADSLNRVLPSTSPTSPPGSTSRPCSSRSNRPSTPCSTPSCRSPRRSRRSWWRQHRPLSNSPSTSRMPPAGLSTMVGSAEGADKITDVPHRRHRLAAFVGRPARVGERRPDHRVQRRSGGRGRLRRLAGRDHRPLRRLDGDPSTTRTRWPTSSTGRSTSCTTSARSSKA